MTALRRGVLHVSSVHPPYDPRIFEREACALRDAGYDVAVAMTVARRDRREGIDVLPLGAHGGPRAARLLRDARVVALMLRERRRLMHIHDPELLLAAVLPLCAGARVIYDVHEFYFERIGESAWIPRPLRAALARCYRFVESLVVPHLAGVVVVNEAMMPRYRALAGDDRVALVRNFPRLGRAQLDAARTAPPPLPGPYVVQTGGTSMLRSFHVIVAAAEHLRARGIDAPIVNLGAIDLTAYPAAERATLLARAQACGVHVAGRVSYAEALRWMAHASVGYIPLQHTANYRQCMPQKTFEYLACGLPVVAAGFGELGDFVRASGVGIAVDAEDAAAHADALAALLREGDRRAAACSAVARRADAFAFAGEAERLCALYELANRATARA